MKNFENILMFFLITIFTNCAKEFYSNQELDENIQVNINLEKDTIMTSDNVDFYFIVENQSDKEIYLYVQDDVHSNWYINGEKIEYISVTIENSNKDTLIKPPWHGHAVSIGFNEWYKKLKPNEKHVTKFSLNEWAQVKKPGKYKISLSQRLRLSHEKLQPLYSDKKEARKNFKKIMFLDKNSTVELVIIEPNNN